MQDLKVTLVQADLKWEDPKGNLVHLTDLIKEVKGTDLIVLPEMFTTGFSMNISKAETMNGAAIKWMAEAAKQTGAAITGSLMMKEDDKFYNRLIWMLPDGSFEEYDKRHLFGLGKETENYTKGNARLITELKGWKICPQVCYDLRFPAWNRNRGDYDLLLFVANWPERRSYAWKQLLIARAIENQSYVVGVNRVGNDGLDIYHSGDSRVIDPVGELVFTESDMEVVETVSLSAEKLHEVREKLPFLRDRDEFTLIC